MRSRLLIVAVLAAVGFARPESSAAGPAGFYSVTDLGVFATTNDVVFNPWVGIASFNDEGVIVLNRVGDDGALHSQLIDPAGTQSFELEGQTVRFLAVNQKGQVAGRRGQFAADGTADRSTFRPVVLLNGEETILPGLGSNAAGSATAISDKGRVAGSAATANDDFEDYGTAHAVLWKGGEATDLGTLGGSWSAATDLNENSRVVGIGATGDGQTHPFLYMQGAIRDLGTLGGGCSYPVHINEAGAVAGACMAETGSGNANDFQVVGAKAFLWVDGVMSELPPLAGHSGAVAADIANDGTVVGGSFLVLEAGTNEPHAVIWSGGAPIDLWDRIDTSGGMFPIFATSINEDGRIAAFGLDSATGDVHAIILTPAG